MENLSALLADVTSPHGMAGGQMGCAITKNSREEGCMQLSKAAGRVDPIAQESTIVTR